MANAFAATGPPPNVILITLDTVRADRMGFLGSTRGLTPNLDALARQSVVFTRAYSQVPLTAPSHATILTGTYPQFHQVSDFQVPLAEDLPYMPQIFSAHGYRTAAFIGASVLDPHLHFAPGFDRGFDTYDAGFRTRGPKEDRYHTTERRGSEVVARALAWLNQHPKGPFFIWVHLYDAHHPYDPPQPYKSKYASEPYDGEIAYVDWAVGKFLNALRTHGLYDNSLIAVMADHGEALGDHGEQTHGIFLYDETIHVPLEIKFPHSNDAGKRIDRQVGLVDVLPTILQSAGLDIPKEVQGEPLTDLITKKPIVAEDKSLAERPLYSETDYPHRAYGWNSLQALRTEKYVYIKSSRPELYDQQSDPAERHNLFASSIAVGSTLAGQLDAFREKTVNRHDAPKIVADPDAQQKLAALGYMATSADASGLSATNVGADPKDKIAIANLSSQANFLMEESNYEKAVPLLQELIAKDPVAPFPYLQLARSFIAMKKYAEALPILRKLLELNPDLSAAHFQLAVALLSSGDIAAAIPELEILAEKEPHSDNAHLMLATAYAQTDRKREAVTECEKVLELSPNHYAALLLEGRVLLLSKQPEAAVPRLERAAMLLPTQAEPHENLAEAYEQLSRKTDATRERAIAKRLSGNGDK